MPRIMIVDDFEPNRRLLVGLLSKLGFSDPVVFDNASEALFAYLREDFDLVFLDILMPEVSGREFLTIVNELRIRKLVPRTQNVVVITAISDVNELRELASFESVYTVIRKPVRKESLHWLMEGFSMLQKYDVC